jgi:conjugative relaxase-like TrwC/TraI family protein
MLRITPQLNADAAKRYQAQHLSKGDYYLSESENYGRWQGQGAEMLGLKEGSVIAKQDYDRLCENKRPDDGSRLTMRNKGNRRVAYDFTFSVPKDVSVLAYTTGDQRITEAFHESCRYTMREVEHDTSVRDRKHGADGDRKSGNLVVAEFRHDTSRPVGAHLPDPHLHAHYVVFNASFDPVEKKFKAVQFGELKRDGPYYQEIQINRFAYSMRELGYPLTASRNGFYRVEGLPTSVTQNFSKRSAQIEQEIARRGLVRGSKLAKEVTLKTRQYKIKGLSRADLVREWKAAIAPKDWAAVEKVRAAATASLPKEGIAHNKAVEDAVKHCFERKSVVRDTQVLQAALKIGRGEVELDELKKEFSFQEHKRDLLREGREVTTPETLRAERQYVEWAVMGRNQHSILGAALPLPSFLSKDQVKAVHAVLNSKDTVTGIIGDAGAGKTTIMGGGAVGYVAYGGAAVGWLGAAGGAALAHDFAVGGAAVARHANDHAARAFMQGSTFFRYAERFTWTMLAISWVPTMVRVYVKLRRKSTFQTTKSTFIAFLIGLLVLQGPTATAEPWSNRITVTVRGNGPDVVLIPGLASSSAVWDVTATHLEGRYRLHIVQVAGFAGSLPQANAQGPVIQPTVDAIDAYIKINKLKEPKVIGHSLGGLMGLMLALQHPEDVGKLMIVDSLPFFSVLFGANDIAAAAPQAAAMRDTIINETQDAYAQGEKAFLPTLIKSPTGLKMATQWAIASDKSVVARAMYEDMTTDIRPRLREIKTPVTILYPWDPSTGMTQPAVDGFYRGNFASLPNKTTVRIDNSFHFIMLDQPDVFAAQIEAFLK